MPEIKKLQKGQKITAAWLNSLVDAIKTSLKVYAYPPLQITANSGGMTISFVGDLSTCKWFYTTGIIGYATLSGTSVSNASMKMGSGTARSCSTNASDPNNITVTPDSGGTDDTIYNGLGSPNIKSGSFVLCSRVDGVWVVVLIPC